MATKNEKDECLQLREFKDYLTQFANVGAENVCGAQNNAITREIRETYTINSTELKAELVNSIWNQLQLKRCPENFQLKIFHHLLNKLEIECHNVKDNNTVTISATNCNGDSSDKFQYDLAKLHKYVSNSLEKFLTHLSDNFEAQNLKTYADENSLCENLQCKCQESGVLSKGTNKRFVVGFIKNKPRKMEDKNICLERFSEIFELKTNSSFYGVFDGHSGPLAASYATSQLPNLLAKQLKETKPPSTIDEYRECFETAFLQTDKQFIQKNISSGTTAVCALITGTMLNQSHLYIAWVGDSRALLVGPEVSLQLVKSHKPDSAEERQRIEEAGGSVMFVQGQWRVNGFLNVSRSIGDYAVGAVIAEPDFVDVPLCSQHDFLILGTDGLWDYVQEAKIVTTIYEALENEEIVVEDIPKKLIEMAKDGDSQDNITVVIIFLKERTEIVKNRHKQKTVLS